MYFNENCHGYCRVFMWVFCEIYSSGCHSLGTKEYPVFGMGTGRLLMTHLAGYLLTDVEDTWEVWFRFWVVETLKIKAFKLWRLRLPPSPLLASVEGAIWLPKTWIILGTRRYWCVAQFRIVLFSSPLPGIQWLLKTLMTWAKSSSLPHITAEMKIKADNYMDIVPRKNGIARDADVSPWLISEIIWSYPWGP